MADELDTGTPPEQVDAPATPSVRDTLAEAMTQFEQSTDQSPAAQRARDDLGRFAKTDAERAAEDAAGAKAPKPAAATQPQDSVADAQATDPAVPAAVQAPQHWPDAVKQQFATLPPESQAFLADAHKSMQADYTRKTQEIAAFRKDYEPVANLFAPFRQAMHNSGYTPESYVKAWADVETQLGQGKIAQVALNTARQYGKDVGELIAELQQLAGGHAPQQPTQQEYTDPVVAKLQGQINELASAYKRDVTEIKGSLTARERAEQEAALRTTTGHMDTFATEKDGTGKPAHPHFAHPAVMQMMIDLAHANKQAGRSSELKSLYDTAVWSVPEVRDLILAEREQATQAARTQADREASARARKAGVSVTGAPGPGTATSRPKANQSVRETLMDAAAQHLDA